MSAAVSGCCERMQSILMLYLNWHGLLYWELLLSQREPGDFWGTWLSNQAADCPVKGALSTSFAFSTEKFFSVFFIFGEPTYLLQLQSQIFVSHVKQISSTIPFHQIRVKRNTSVVCFLVRISTWNQLIPIYWKKKKQPTNQKPKRPSLCHLNISELLTSPSHM